MDGGCGEGVISGIHIIYSKNEVGTCKVKWIQGVIVGLWLKRGSGGAETSEKLQKIFTAWKGVLAYDNNKIKGDVCGAVCAMFVENGCVCFCYGYTKDEKWL